jgi:hypothetical protein
MKLGWDGDASEAVVFDEDMRLLSTLVLKYRSEPGVYEAGNVDGGRGDEVVPTGQGVVAMPEEGEHENDNRNEM